MPLSKARDKERKRLARLENKKVQPEFKTYHERESIIINGITLYTVPEGKALTVEIDADGNVILEY